MPRRFLIVVLILLTASLLAGCAQKDAAPKAVQTYLQALVDKDLNQMLAVSCAAWEEGATAEYDSFQAVATTLKDVSCTQTGGDGDTALVTCQGAIAATYNAEVQEFDLSRRPFKVVKEGGELRVCGYQ
jgi:hypothetical protein